jgi:ssDNA-binding Zn-finger/Zn-ribbon topoisomerase 1
VNANCLEDKQCPKCKQEDEVLILTAVWISLKDEGTDPFSDSLKNLGDTDYDEKAVARCPECGFEGTVADFTKE